MLPKKNNRRGFTLIELLVVIGIIGVLASVVLAGLNSARKGGNDAKVKGQLDLVRKSAALYYSDNENYGNTTNSCSEFFVDVTSGMFVATNPSTFPSGVIRSCRANSATQTYVMAVTLSGYAGTVGDQWCVDSTGASKKISLSLLKNGVTSWSCNSLYVDTDPGHGPGDGDPVGLE